MSQGGRRQLNAKLLLKYCSLSQLDAGNKVAIWLETAKQNVMGSCKSAIKYHFATIVQYLLSSIYSSNV